MTAKALTLALAATTAAATFADVFEVKFTMKTKVGEKVANKVISGIYDSDQDKHVFWTVEKVANEKGKLVNTNVPYQGTYFGTANGTEVGKSVGSNAELIWGGEDSPANVLVAGAWGKATSLSGQAAGMLDNVPATGTWSAKVNTKMSYDQLLAKYGLTQSETLSKDEIAGTIDQIKGEIKGIVEALENLSDAGAAAMLGDTIRANYKAAEKVYIAATNKIDVAEQAYDAYAEAAEMDDDDYQAIIDEKQAEYDAALAAYDAVTYTNNIVKQSNTRAATNQIGNLIKTCISNTNKWTTALDKEPANYDTYTNSLYEAIYGDGSLNEGSKKAMDDAYVTMTNKADLAEQAQAYVDGDDWEPTVEDFATWSANKPQSDWDALKQKKEYDKYVEGLFANAWKDATNALATATADAEGAEDAYNTAKDKYDADVKAYDDAVASGETATAAELKEKIAAEVKKIEAYEADIAYWGTAYDEIVTANYKNQITADLKAATTARDDASKALTDAKNAKNNKAKNLDTLLDTLAKAIDLTGKDALKKDGNALPLDEIEAKVDAFIAETQGYADEAEQTMTDAEILAARIGLELN